MLFLIYLYDQLNCRRKMCIQCLVIKSRNQFYLMEVTKREVLSNTALTKIILFLNLQISLGLGHYIFNFQNSSLITTTVQVLSKYFFYSPFALITRCFVINLYLRMTKLINSNLLAETSELPKTFSKKYYLCYYQVLLQEMHIYIKIRTSRTMTTKMTFSGKS